LFLLGFGKTTISTAKYLNSNFKEAKIKISELKEKENFDLSIIEELEKTGIEFEFGKQTENFIFEKDAFIVISPGIPPKVELIQKILHSDFDHGTDLDLFAAVLSDEQNYVSITGTNGKTTTTSILSHIFNSPSLGNIGTPFLEFDKEFFPNFACEISSFQAFYSKHFQDLKIPKVSIFLNFTADHLDWHRDLNEYHAAKAKLFCQSEKEENYWILNFDDPKVKNLGLNSNFKANTKTKVCYFATDDISYALSESCPFVAYIKNKRLYLAQYLGDASGADLVGDAIVSVNDNDDYFVELPLLKLEELKLVGKHNYTNILAASLAAYLMKFDLSYIIEKLEDFTPVPHRLEYIREIGNNKVYNDSKATNPDSTIKAIESFDQSILILGGKEKNLDLTEFLNRVSKKAYAVVAIGEIKDKIYNRLRELNFDKVRRAESLEEALSICVLYTDNNNYPIVLSPASSSFDMFKGFEDRGNQFKEIVLKY
jgi:UDP-N-acetylmuramoylalanine--D-glutamate ligase